MASAVHCKLNPQVRPFVPTIVAPKLAYRRGKREGEEEPVSKYQLCSGDGRWAGRRGVGRLDPRRETKVQGKDRDRERGKIAKNHKEEDNFGAQTEAARKSTAAPPATKQNEQSSTCAWTGDHSCHTQRPGDGDG